MWGLRQSGCAVQTASSCGCGLQRQQQPQALRRQQRLSLRVFLRMPAGVVSGHWPAELRFRVQGLAELTPLLSWLYGFALPAHPLLLLLLLQNGGGAHAGQQWTPELPCDSALLFYLFAAFVAAPGWNFPPPGAGGPDNSRCDFSPAGLTACGLPGTHVCL